MLNRRSLLASIPGLALAQNQKFARNYFYIKPDSKLVLIDFTVGSDKVAWAVGGTISDGGRTKGVILSTSNAGQSWALAELKFLPRSLFALDDSSLWAVSEKGEIWFTAEGGRDWRKLSRQEPALRVHFLNNQTGFLIGRKKTFMRSDDAGKTWRHVPAAAQVGTTSSNITFRAIDFWNGKIGLVAGSADPPERRGRIVLPDWMEPEIASYRNNRPGLMAGLETMDGGATWVKQEVSGFGYVNKSMIGSDGTGFTLVKFDRSFTFGGELYSFYPRSDKKGALLLRPKDLELQDVSYIPGDGVYVAATERQGNLPVPTKVRIKYSKDFIKWVDIAVDYRAVARKVILATTPSGKIFAALDQGTILALQ